MDNLPTEVVYTIAGYMSDSVLKVFRETSKRNSEVGAALLFAELRSTVSKLSFERLSEIALCPTISKLVRSFYLDTTALNEAVQEFADWENLVIAEHLEMIEMVGSDPEYQEERIKESYEEFSSMFARQLVPSSKITGITQIIRHFKSLKTVSIFSGGGFTNIEGFPLASKSNEKKGSLPALIQKYVLKSIGSDTDTPNITTLSIALPWTTVEDRLDECILAGQIGLQNWQSIRKIEISLLCDGEYSQPKPFLAVRSFLKMLQNIQELTIIIGCCDISVTDPSLEDILDIEFKWPYRPGVVGSVAASPSSHVYVQHNGR